MAYYNNRRRNYYYRSELEEPKIIQLVPSPQHVVAVYIDDGEEVRETVPLIALFDNGNIQFLSPSSDGGFDCPEITTNFLRYEIMG